MEAVLLADRPDLIPALAAAYRAEWPEWYGRGGLGDAEADLNERARRSGLPDMTSPPVRYRISARTVSIGRTHRVRARDVRGSA